MTHDTPTGLPRSSCPDQETLNELHFKKLFEEELQAARDSVAWINGTLRRCVGKVDDQLVCMTCGSPLGDLKGGAGQASCTAACPLRRMHELMDEVERREQRRLRTARLFAESITPDLDRAANREHLEEILARERFANTISWIACLDRGLHEQVLADVERRRRELNTTILEPPRA